MSNTAIISVVDDDESVRKALDGLLRSSGYTVHTYASALEFLSGGGPEQTDCLLSDIRMPGMSGIELCNELAARNIRIPVIIISGHPGPPPRVKPGVAEPVALFPKPFGCVELIACIESVLKHTV
ncbi:MULTISPECIES: response regulator transcription factor [Pseudomonas]|jgi:FixJ family two-component response regulator|uniref:response regulator transcription factor n=1 Tax=Pseudomonas TaxID=286 RepID=UPI00087723D9|nr:MULTISPECIES: response regulator [Pseudomonas]MDB6442432.1 response regulator [Pseudomonas sp. 21TX0197]MDT8905735.1 response regulator [Pseudomonas prosekii]NHN68072.1 response regulator [Pseudomonas fluorescens]ROO34837.1 two-component system response regulator [Pseudomonas sp. 7SR1]ROO42332.1 two-component system response regulator [Pseudomonas sp. AF76]